MVGWWWWLNVKFYYLSCILGWKKGERMEISTLSWYWRIVSSSWRFIPPFAFGSCSYLWKSLLPLNNNYWLFLIYCAWCIVVYWCNSYTIVHFSLDIVEWFNYKLKKVLNCTWYWFTPLSVSTIGIRARLPSEQFNHWKENPQHKWMTMSTFQMGFKNLMEEIMHIGVIEWKLT